MQKDELQEVVEFFAVSWNKGISKNEVTLMVKNFWPYMKDLNKTDVLATIQEMSMGRQWAPRPAELRIAALAKSSEDGLPPEPEEAWAILQTISKEIYGGKNNYDKPHEVLRKTIRKLGGTNATALHTNSDRDTFISLYSKIREEYILENYGFKGK